MSILRTLVGPIALGMMLFFLTPARAAVTPIYWDFNNGTKTPEDGTGTLTTSASGINFPEIETFLLGTDLNELRPPVDENLALTYLDLVEVFSDHTLLFSGLDLSDMRNVKMSFAFRTMELFELTSEVMIVDYDPLGGTNFIGAQSILLWESHWHDWSRVEFSFGSDLDNMANASIRIRTLALFEVGSELQFDNFVIVPEPASATLALAGAMLLIARRRRQG